MKNKNKKNKTYAKKLTKHQMKKEITKFKFILIATATMVSAGIILGNSITPNYETTNIIVPKKVEAAEPFEYYEVISETIREVTAYNAGDPTQTDSSPCISANMTNICEGLAQGKLYCAANFVPFGTLLQIENYGLCEVVDRMNSRYQNRVDIAMQAHEKPRAYKFGMQNLNVRVVQ